MPLKFVLFDLDGTLLDTLDDLADATNAALGRFGLPPLPAADYKLLVGNGVRVLMQRAVAASQALLAQAPDNVRENAMDRAQGGMSVDALVDALGDARVDVLGDARVDVLVDAFNREYEARWACRTRPYDGIPELLDALRAAGLRLGILSNKPDAFTCRIVERFFPDKMFDMVTGMRPEYPAKPDPGLATALCREAGAAPAETALVGDSGTDMLTAQAAGLEPIGVLWGFRSADELIAAGARQLAASPSELAALLVSRQRAEVADAPLSPGR